MNSIFKFVTDHSIEDYQTIGHNTIFDAILLLPDEEIGASKAIIELYHRILQEKKQAGLPTPLLSHFINIQNPINKEPVSVENFINHNATHLGQMRFEFPISISQRKALYTLNSKEQKVFAINGPPGTGKTTLLQTIVANEMVISAIAGKEPTIILACSNNNQAVTNIIDSFSKSNTKKGDLQGRWLPDISGYATYLPGLSKTNSELEGINYKKLDKSGLFSRVESGNYLANAKEHFLDKAAKWIDIKREVITVERTIEILRNKIISTQKQLEDAAKKWRSYLDAEAEFSKYYINDKMDANNYYEKNTLSISALQTDIDALKIVETTINQYFDNEPFFRKLFCWFSCSVPHKNRYAQINILLRDTIIDDNKLPLKCNRSNILEMIDKKISMAKKNYKKHFILD
ncbi:MAG: AAA family ATPase [Haliscomenobacter sp.]|nr:AAA family ATPase [Haliscomenobacter sp.]